MGTEKSAADALKWYRAAADAGRINSQVAAAQMLLDGTAGFRDVDAARRYAETAKNAGALEADSLLARIAASK